MTTEPSRARDWRGDMANKPQFHLLLFGCCVLFLRAHYSVVGNTSLLGERHRRDADTVRPPPAGAPGDAAAFGPGLARLGRRVDEALGRRFLTGEAHASIRTQPDYAQYERTPLKAGQQLYPPMHFRATRFALSPNRPLFASPDDFAFRPLAPAAGARSWRAAWDGAADGARSAPACADRVVCHVDRAYRNLGHWQHYMHFAFPCWSLFRRFPHATDRVIDLHATRAVDATTGGVGAEPWAAWTLGLNGHFEKAGIRFMATPFERAEEKEEEEEEEEESPSSQCDWMANTKLNFDGLGFQQPHGKSPYMNSYYFMDPEDVYAFQRQVLGDEQYRRGPSLLTPAHGGDDDEEGGRAFRVAILNREDGDERLWAYGRETAHLLRDAWGDVLDVQYLGSYAGFSFEEQAAHMHSVDLVISPHGAQLTNTVYVRPCTVVLELLPPKFYHPRKLALAMEAGGVAFYGYPHGGSPIAETPAHDPATGAPADGADWGAVRDVKQIRASPESVLFALPELVQAGIDCRRQWLATH